MLAQLPPQGTVEIATTRAEYGNTRCVWERVHNARDLLDNQQSMISGNKWYQLYHTINTTDKQHLDTIRHQATYHDATTQQYKLTNNTEQLQ